jgi:GNAT superfamily N-acetyltransferase
LGQQDVGYLANVLPGVFDNPVDNRLSAEFLADPRHHLVVAIDDGAIIGFASAVHYVHPDKPAELWINEVGVASSYCNRGMAKRILAELLELGRRLGCRDAWVLTDRSNPAAMQLYESLGGTGTDHVMFSFGLKE